MKDTLILISAAVLVLLAEPTQAQGRYYPDRFASCSGFDLPEGSAGVFFSTDCSTAFLMPSSKGSLSTTTVLPSPHLQACIVRDAQIRATELALENMGLSENNNTRTTDNRQCGLIKTRLRRLAQRGSTIELDLSFELSRIERLEQQREVCVEAKQICTNIYSELDVAFRKKLSLEHQQLISHNDLSSIEERYPECIDDNQNDNSVSSDTFIKLSELSESLLSSSENELEGDTVNVIISLEHHKHVTEARRKNPDFTVVAAPLDLGLSVSVAEDSFVGRSAVKRSTVPLLSAPSEFFASEGNNDPTGVSTRVFGPTASGQIVLSIDGACAARRQGLDHRFLAGYLVANIIYRMPMKLSLSIKAEANFEELYSRVAKQSTRGGFFRTSSSSSVVNSLRSDEVVSVIVTDDGVLTDSERLELVTAVKDRIIQRGLDLVAREYLPNAAYLTVSPPDENGAEVASEGIRKSCKAKWCQVTAIVLDVGNAIFGGTDAIQSFVRERSVDLEEVISIDSIYYNYGSIGLVVE